MKYGVISIKLSDEARVAAAELCRISGRSLTNIIRVLIVWAATHREESVKILGEVYPFSDNSEERK